MRTASRTIRDSIACARSPRRKAPWSVPVCAAIEAEISQLEEADRAEFLKELKLDEPGLNRVIRGGYALLGLQTYFTAGVKEVRAWTVRAGATAPQAAGVIHTDFEHGFIRAEVIAYEDFIALQGRGRREGGRQAAARGQGVHRARRRCDALQIQCLNGGRVKWLIPNLAGAKAA